MANVISDLDYFSKSVSGLSHGFQNDSEDLFSHFQHTTQVVVNPTQFPLSSSLMIGDYMVPNNIILPSAQQGVNILHYKTVGDV